MNSNKIGPDGVHYEPPQDVQSQETFVQVQKTDLKNEEIPSAGSQQVVLSPEQFAKSIIALDDPSFKQKVIDELEKQIESVTALKDLPPLPLRSITKEGRERVIQHIEMFLDFFQFPGNLFHKLVTLPDFYLGPFINMPKNTQDNLQSVITPIEVARTILQALTLLEKGAELIIQSEYCQELNHLLKNEEILFKEKPEAEELRSHIAQLRHHHSIQREILKDKILDFITAFLTVSVRATSFIMSAMKNVLLIAKRAASWAYCLLDVIEEAIGLWRAQKAKTTHEAWMIHLASNQRSVDEATDLLKKRLVRKILEKAEKMDFQDLMKTLEEKNVDFNEESVTNFEKFKSLLLSDEDHACAFRKELGNKFLDEKERDEIDNNVMTRNGIQALAEAKVKNNKKFFDFKLTSSKLGLSVASLTAALTITLHILALVGVVALTGAALATPGLGFFIFGIVLTAIGLYFFYKYKPNLFQCFIKGVNFRLAFLEIPAKIRNLQLLSKRNEIKELEIMSANLEQLDGLSKQHHALTNLSYPNGCSEVLLKMQHDTAEKTDQFEKDGLPTELENKKKLHQKKLEEARAQEEELNQKVDYWLGKEGVVTKLQNQLREAGVKDFARENHLLTTVQDMKLNLPGVIVEKFFNPAFNYKFDDETIKILKEKMGIDIEQIPYLTEENLKTQLKDFFKMDDTELLTFMKNQLSNLEIAKAKTYQQPVEI